MKVNRIAKLALCTLLAGGTTSLAQAVSLKTCLLALMLLGTSALPHDTYLQHLQEGLPLECGVLIQHQYRQAFPEMQICMTRCLTEDEGSTQFECLTRCAPTYQQGMRRFRQQEGALRLELAQCRQNPGTFQLPADAWDDTTFFIWPDDSSNDPNEVTE